MSTHGREHEQPTVMIAGAGLGGLMLGILLEQIGVPYHIYERSTESRALGSAMTMGGNVLPIFEQLGLFQELQKISHPLWNLDLYNANMEKTGSIQRKGLKDA